MTAELSDDLVKQYETNIPAKRFGSTDDVAFFVPLTVVPEEDLVARGRAQPAEVGRCRGREAEEVSVGARSASLLATPLEERLRHGTA